MSQRLCACTWMTILPQTSCFTSYKEKKYLYKRRLWGSELYQIIQIWHSDVLALIHCWSLLSQNMFYWKIFTVPEVDDSPERKLELLYGVTLPDWCVNGTDLPGVYKEITDKTMEGSDVIDTNRLFPILMASDLPRDQLGQIWNRANRNVPGQLNALELRIVLGLVALAQVCSVICLSIW